MVNVNNRLLYICVGPLFKYLKMNILLDTNILIPLEDTRRILESSFAEMRKLSAEQQHCLYIHPMQIQDIKRDRNEMRKSIVISRLAQYPQIENPPI